MMNVAMKCGEGRLSRWFPSAADYPESRLFSLDALRGLDMLLLTVVGPLLMAANRGWKCFSPGFMGQLQHGWECFTLWDIIMPLFIFMCGAAVPLALTRRLKEGQGVYWRHVLWRVVFLWTLGGLVQCKWALLDPLQTTLFSNTLQSIAVGYLAAAAVMLVPKLTVRVAIAAVLAAVYGLALHFGGDYTKEGNLAVVVDRAVNAAIYPAGHARVKQEFLVYSWYLTSLMFAFMTLCGLFATEILRSAMTPWKKARASFAYGFGMLAAGWILSVWVPVIKPIYTVSFTLQAMGWCELALAVLYVVCDIWKVRRGFSPVLLFGQLALTAYFVSHFFGPALTAGAHSCADGLLSWLPKSAAPFVLRLFFTAELVAVMVIWRKAKRA